MTGQPSAPSALTCGGDFGRACRSRINACNVRAASEGRIWVRGVVTGRTEGVGRSNKRFEFSPRSHSQQRGVQSIIRSARHVRYYTDLKKLVPAVMSIKPYPANALSLVTLTGQRTRSRPRAASGDRIASIGAPVAAGQRQFEQRPRWSTPPAALTHGRRGRPAESRTRKTPVTNVV